MSPGGDDFPFTYEPAPDHPGWFTWNLRDPTSFNTVVEPLFARPAQDGIARLRMVPEARHQNLGGVVHGGALLTFIDIALFAGAHMLGVDIVGGGLTVDLSTQFVGAGRIGVPLDAELELVRGGGKLIFLRGRLVQEVDGEVGPVAAFSGLLKKTVPREAS